MRLRRGIITPRWMSSGRWCWEIRISPYTDATTGRWGVFGDLRSGYVIRRVKDLTLIVNPYSRANEGQVEYTLWARADGVPQDTAAYRVLVNEAA
ncbi:hypothetical protein MHAS_00697 [Mycolicibacterium hassiacum DSM 44199]|nr:hypothetical protein MHAS_00697 [Mycolicibacterium hassiacum DSM 44199]